MTYNQYIDSENQAYTERYQLASGRVTVVNAETNISLKLPEELSSYFNQTSYFLMQTCNAYSLASSGTLGQMDILALQNLNQSLYKDIKADNYKQSYANPVFAAERLGKEYSTILSVLYTELRISITYAFEKRLSALVPLLELYIQVYNILEDNPSAIKEVQSAIYYYFFDYIDIMETSRMKLLLEHGLSPVKDIIMEKDLSEPSYLYLFGEYISENELETSRYLSTLTEDKIKSLAKTFTEGYRKGFEIYRIDLSNKKTVNIRYPLGFERIVKEAVHQFKEMGLEACIYMACHSLIYRFPGGRNGCYGSSANRQYNYDHRMDCSVIFDKAFADRRLNAKRKAFENYKKEALFYSGIAVMETFGEEDFTPVDKNEASRFNKKQQKQYKDYIAAASLLTNEFIPGDTTSFTIIAYPVPGIGKDYKEIFNETIKVNTLDSFMYERIQTCLVNALDTGDYVTITGRGQNITNINIALSPVNNPLKETKFENCLDDVNIPLGEVFTSPQLKGTDGLLHVTSACLDGLVYNDLKLNFKDGVITDYSCSNFDTEEENKRYIHENLMHQHNTLPMGEFAIGTNTTAYKMGQKYNISHKLPILIAEKTGPHFAIGDTCFSHEEDMCTYNPDGKEMKCKENDFSRLRNTDPSHAYFNCHTDITIPYNELGDITVHQNNGGLVKIIENGKFVLPGTEELNKALDF
ncbi:MAG: aminopeptidase [Lachnospiraceae bacterium]